MTGMDGPALNNVVVQSPWAALLSADTYIVGDEPRYCALFTPQPALPFHGAAAPIRMSSAYDLDTVGDHAGGFRSSEKTDAFYRGFNRPEIVVPFRLNEVGMKRQTLALWRGDTLVKWPQDLTEPFDMGVTVYGPMTKAEAEAKTSEMSSEEGRWPYFVGASGHPSSVRFCVGYAPTGQHNPLPRYGVVVDARDEDPPARVGPTKIVDGAKLKNVVAGSRAQAKRFDLRQPISLEFFAARFASRVASGGSNDRQPPIAADASTTQGIASMPSVTAGVPAGVPSLQPQPQPPSMSEDLVGVDGAGGTVSSALAGIEFRRLRLEQMDQDILAWMRLTGARAVQIALAYDGRLVLVRAYTLAELGYPVALITTRFPWASVAKVLLAMTVVSAFAPNGTVEELRSKNLVELFEISPNPANPNHPWLAITNIEDLLRHRSGWANEYTVSGYIVDGVKTGGDYYEWAAALSAGASGPPAQPGDTRAMLQTWPYLFYGRNPGGWGSQGAPAWRLMAAAPGTSNVLPGSAYDYHGITMRALGELIGKTLPASIGVPDWDQYENAQRGWWRLEDPIWAPRVLTRDREQVLGYGVVPMHSMTPSLGDLFHEDGVQRLTPFQYYASPWGAPAGGWAMSAAVVARILQGMDGQGPYQPRLLSPAQRNLLALPDPQNVGQGMTWGVGFPMVGPWQATQLSFAGAVAGCRSYAEHMYWTELDHGVSRKRSRSYARSINLDTFAMAPPFDTIIFDAANDIEAKGLWPDADLFDHLGLREAPPP